MAELQSGASGVLRFIAQEILNIIDGGVGDLFRDAINQINSGNFYQAGYDSGQILGILLNPGSLENVVAEQQ